MTLEAMVVHALDELDMPWTWFRVEKTVDGRPAILLSDVRAGWRWTRGYVENVAAAIANVHAGKSTRDRCHCEFGAIVVSSNVECRLDLSPSHTTIG